MLTRRPMLTRRMILTAFSAISLGLASLATAYPSQAADWPSKRITIIVPYSAGGSTDVLARQLAELIAPVLDENVVVENRPGAGATLGTTMAANARGDGYTWFLGQVSSHGIAPAVYANLQYDPLGDFTPVTHLISIPNVMVVNKNSPVSSMAEFIEMARKEPVTFASSGVGSSIHLSGEMFKSMLGLENMTHVPYRGSGEAVPALLAGDVDVMFDNLPSAIPHIRSGDLKPLAVTTPERAEALPDVPTVAELGGPELADFQARSWFGVFVQDDVDPEIVTKIGDAVNQVLGMDAFKAFAQNRGATIEGGSREAFVDFVEFELNKWKTVVEAAGVRVE